MAEIYCKQNSDLQYESVPSTAEDTVFCIEKGKGEFRDEINHVNEDFIIEEEIVPAGGYYVNDACILCGTCYAVCPKQCIDTAKDPVVINQSECIQCGECVKVCPVQAIEKK